MFKIAAVGFEASCRGAARRTLGWTDSGFGLSSLLRATESRPEERVLVKRYSPIFARATALLVPFLTLLKGSLRERRPVNRRSIANALFRHKPSRQNSLE